MRSRTGEQGSVVIVAVAMLLLLSLLAVTYVTVMELEVRSNEAYQYGMKADMIINWFIADACALIQASIRNVGIYEVEAPPLSGNYSAFAVWDGVNYASPDSVLINPYGGASWSHPHPMSWRNPPKQWHMLPLLDHRRDDADYYNGWYSVSSDYYIFFGAYTTEGMMFGEEGQWVEYSNSEDYEMDLINFDGDYDARTHRQARWRSFRNADPDYDDVWDNMYARAAGVIVSTQAMLYLGEYRGDFTDRISRSNGGKLVKGHHRRMNKENSTGNLRENCRPIGYNLACYKAGFSSDNTRTWAHSSGWHQDDRVNDLTHEGMERVDRSLLSPSPYVQGLSVSQGTKWIKRLIPGLYPAGGSTLQDNSTTDPDSWPDITKWNGGEGMMNINALIRILQHFVNERAAYAIAKHRPYRTKQQILEAVDIEGAMLTTVEYSRLMASVTCHSNYDPITGFCPLNINKLRAPVYLLREDEVTPDPLLIGPPGKFYDKDITNYRPFPSGASEWDENYRIRIVSRSSARYDIVDKHKTHGDDDPSTGIYFSNNAPGVLLTERLMWAVFSCIPSMVIDHDLSNNSPDPFLHKDPWATMAKMTHNPMKTGFYDRGIQSAPTKPEIQGRFTASKVLQTVVGFFHLETSGRMNWPGATLKESSGGSRIWTNFVHPSMIAGLKGAGGVDDARAIRIGDPLLNTMTGQRGTLAQMTNTGNPGSQYFYWGWTPVMAGNTGVSDPVRGFGAGNSISPIAKIFYGFHIENIDRFEHMVAWLAPFHPVANPIGHDVITERQANDILNNFIDFRDNVDDPNNLLTDWKLHSQEYDRGNYESFAKTRALGGGIAKGIHKDGYINDDAGANEHINTVCSMGNYKSTTNALQCQFPDAGASQGSGLKAKVPYVYIKEPYYEKTWDALHPDFNRASSTDAKKYFRDELKWTDRVGIPRGGSVIEMVWNFHAGAGGSGYGYGYGDPEIYLRLKDHTDINHPWVNDMQHQEFNIIGIRENESVIEGKYKDVSWMRNYNWCNLNWTKDWLAYNYHRNVHDPEELKNNVSFPPGFPNNSDIIAEHKRINNTFSNPRYDPAGEVDGDEEFMNRHVYYESPGLIFGADRIPDAYQTLTRGNVLVDLSYYPIDQEGRPGEPDPGKPTIWKQIFTDLYEGDKRAMGGENYADKISDICLNNDRIWDGSNPSLYKSIYNNYEFAWGSAPRENYFDGSFQAFMWNTTRSGSYGLPDSTRYPGVRFMDYCFKVMTHFGYRGFDGPGSTSWLAGRFDYKNDTPYFMGMHHANKEVFSPFPQGRDFCAWSVNAALITLYNKPYLYDVPMKSIKKSQAPFTNVTFGYSYNYGRNIYAFDFDGSALAVRSGYDDGGIARNSQTGDPDEICYTMLKMIENAPNINYEYEYYGEKGLVAGVAYKFKMTGTGDLTKGYDLSKVAQKITGVNTMNPIVPRFNAVEPFFDPMYPNGRLFYRRLMTCGDTTIALNANYRLSTVKNSPNGILYNNYDPDNYDTWTAMNNLFETVKYMNVEYEDNVTLVQNPFLQDNAARLGVGPEVWTETWPVAGGDVNSGLGGSNSAAHWNHVYNARYSVPWIVDTTGAAAAQASHLCADSPWSVPFCVNDRFYEIRVKAEIINTGLAKEVTGSGATIRPRDEWRGVDILASKQALAIFDRGWRWAYWDDIIGEASPYYDAFKMVGSRPGVDAAYGTMAGAVQLDQEYGGMMYDNEMYHYNDFDTALGKYRRAKDIKQVPAGYIAPAEYSGVNRPGDDCAQRARIVFFQWLSNQ